MNTPTWSLSLGVAFLVLSLFTGVYYMGKCSGTPPPIIDTGIDAGPGLDDIDAREAAEELDATRRLEHIETKRREDIEALEASQREEYDSVRAEGPDAVLDWLSAFDRARFDHVQTLRRDSRPAVP